MKYRNRIFPRLIPPVNLSTSPSGATSVQVFHRESLFRRWLQVICPRTARGRLLFRRSHRPIFLPPIRSTILLLWSIRPMLPRESQGVCHSLPLLPPMPPRTLHGGFRFPRLRIRICPRKPHATLHSRCLFPPHNQRLMPLK